MNSNIRKLGDGHQWFSWVARDEMATIVCHVLITDAMEGPVNAVSPNPVRNAEFFATLGLVLGRKPWLPMPAFALQLILGDMADRLILASRRIEPCRLLETGYIFRFPQLEVALRHEIEMIGLSSMK
jgi:NAD dependent epimerase/dehydratase family enzyme